MDPGVGSVAEAWYLIVCGGDASATEGSCMVEVGPGDRFRGGCVDGGGVMLWESGGGEAKADLFIVPLLCEDRVLARGGVEGTWVKLSSRMAVSFVLAIVIDA